MSTTKDRIERMKKLEGESNFLIKTSDILSESHKERKVTNAE
jgi:hypothetical protein